MSKYSYIVIVHNCPELARESALLKNNYKATKYAYIERIMQKDGSESIANIYYSNNLEMLQQRANGFLSWYNYPLNLSKNMQGYIKHIM
jgi:hypothetical protein